MTKARRTPKGLRLRVGRWYESTYGVVIKIVRQTALQSDITPFAGSDGRWYTAEGHRASDINGDLIREVKIVPARGGGKGKR